MLGGRDPSQFSINCSDICLSSSEQIIDSSNDFGQPFLKMDLRRKWSNNPWGSGLRGKNLLLMEKFLRMAEAQRALQGHSRRRRGCHCRAERQAGLVR